MAKSSSFLFAIQMVFPTTGKSMNSGIDKPLAFRQQVVATSVQAGNKDPWIHIVSQHPPRATMVPPQGCGFSSLQGNGDRLQNSEQLILVLVLRPEIPQSKTETATKHTFSLVVAFNDKGPQTKGTTNTCSPPSRATSTLLRSLPHPRNGLSITSDETNGWCPSVSLR